MKSPWYYKKQLKTFKSIIIEIYSVGKSLLEMTEPGSNFFEPDFPLGIQVMIEKYASNLSLYIDHIYSYPSYAFKLDDLTSSLYKATADLIKTCSKVMSSKEEVIENPDNIMNMAQQMSYEMASVCFDFRLILHKSMLLLEYDYNRLLHDIDIISDYKKRKKCKYCGKSYTIKFVKQTYSDKLQLKKEQVTKNGTSNS